MGEFDISGDLESKRPVTKNVKRVIVHRQYDPATFENDLALLEMDSPVQFDTHIGKWVRGDIWVYPRGDVVLNKKKLKLNSTKTKYLCLRHMNLLL